MYTEWLPHYLIRSRSHYNNSVLFYAYREKLECLTDCISMLRPSERDLRHPESPVTDGRLGVRNPEKPAHRPAVNSSAPAP